MNLTLDRRIIWSPSPALEAESALAKFIKYISRTRRVPCDSFESLFQWSIENSNSFWTGVWEFHQLIGEGSIDPVFAPGGEHRMWGSWFPRLSLNYAENLLRTSGTGPALISWSELGHYKSYSWDQLRAETASVTNFLSSAGFDPGDRIAAFVPNIPEVTVCMLATAARGGVWSSCSPDFGVPAALARFAQLNPKVLVIADGYFHKRSKVSTLEKADELLRQLPSVQKVIVVPFVATKVDFSKIGFHPKVEILDYSEIIGTGGALTFSHVPFSAPLFVLYSSGTTGKPKAIVHSTGGTLIEHVKELSLHTNLGPTERIFYQTTCGWMMWNWLISSLATGATIVMYDGSPLLDDGSILWSLCHQEGVTVFGTNAKYISALEKEKIHPASLFEYPSLRSILSTGSPLTVQSFDFIHEHLKPGIQISSVSGGTDILGCFGLGSPISPVVRGELQVRSLGMNVKVFDDDGQPVLGKVGELVCCDPFPSMPTGFLNDPDKSRYRGAYFEKYADVWYHGDFAEITSAGGMRILGRSDATLNPGGIRIGTAEIYQQVENFPAILESLAVGFEVEGDAKIVLFLRLGDGITLDEALKNEVRSVLRKNLSPFHVPWQIVQAADFPRTQNGKIMELSVRDALRGKKVASSEAMANPGCMAFFEAWAEETRTGS